MLARDHHTHYCVDQMRPRLHNTPGLELTADLSALTSDNLTAGLSVL